jgi:hypothetical protein
MPNRRHSPKAHFFDVERRARSCLMRSTASRGRSHATSRITAIKSDGGPPKSPESLRSDTCFGHILALRWTESMLPRLLLLGEGF